MVGKIERKSERKMKKDFLILGCLILSLFVIMILAGVGVYAEEISDISQENSTTSQEATSQEVTISSVAQEPLVCTQDCSDFVCGSDGKTYCNACIAKNAGVSYKEGECTIETPLVKEQVTCVFDSTNLIQECYARDYKGSGGVSCSGKGSCVIDVVGTKGQSINWKSSCGGYVYTIIDGENEYAKFGCKDNKQESTSTTSIEEKIFTYNTWYKSASWQCYDGIIGSSATNEEGNPCKPAEVWKKYAEKSCNEHCKIIEDSNLTKCGINSFSVSNDCSGEVISSPVCGNGICESGEGQICSVEACEQGKKCEPKLAKCYDNCAKDCNKPNIFANFDEKFKFQMSQTAQIKDGNIHIKFNDLWIPKCATNSNSEKCAGGLPVAVLQLKYLNEKESEKEKNTGVIKLQLNEKKQIDWFSIVFFDYDASSKTGIFSVSKVGEDGGFKCPEKCICDENGKIIECKEKVCAEGLNLCPDGSCNLICEIETNFSKCDYGCLYGGKCLPYGIRANGMFCSIEGDLLTQLGGEKSCENNFECESNVCVSGQCISSGFIEKILSWFKKMFGGS